jgi:hypothetical protein
MTMSHPVAVDTIDIIVWPIGKVGSIQLMFAFGTGETFFVICSRLGCLFFCVKYHALASWTSICFSFFTLNCGDVSRLQIWLRFVSEHMGVAKFTVNVAIRTLSAKLIIQGPFAIAAGEALFMVKSTFGCHFFSLKNFTTTSWTTIFFIFGLN